MRNHEQERIEEEAIIRVALDVLRLAECPELVKLAHINAVKIGQEVENLFEIIQRIETRLDTGMWVPERGMMTW